MMYHSQGTRQRRDTRLTIHSSFDLSKKVGSSSGEKARRSGVKCKQGAVDDADANDGDTYASGGGVKCWIIIYHSQGTR